MRFLELGTEVEDALAPYAAVDRTPAEGRCWVTAHMVAGLDGTAPPSGGVSAPSPPRRTRRCSPTCAPSPTSCSSGRARCARRATDPIRLTEERAAHPGRPRADRSPAAGDRLAVARPRLAVARLRRRRAGEPHDRGHLRGRAGRAPGPGARGRGRAGGRPGVGASPTTCSRQLAARGQQTGALRGRAEPARRARRRRARGRAVPDDLADDGRGPAPRRGVPARVRRSPASRCGTCCARTTPCSCATRWTAMTDAFDSLMASLDGPMAVVTTAVAGERAGCLVGFHAQSAIDPRALLRVALEGQPHLPGGAAFHPPRRALPHRGRPRGGRALRHPDRRRRRQVRGRRTSTSRRRRTPARAVPAPDGAHPGGAAGRGRRPRVHHR